MNKIYKVIWSKVKHQYVVVSELAHSNGKQSRTSRNSIRSRIAALVVCGAITAFGVYGALPNSAFAENNTKAWQYAAISTDANPDFGIYKREYHKEDVQVNGKYKTYWVRNGYHIDVEQVHRYDSGDKTLVDGTPTLMPVYDDVIRVYRADDWEESNADGLLSSMKVSNSNMGITTLNGKDLQDVTAGTFVGASSGGGTQVPSNYNYLINDNGKWIDAGGSKFKNYFKEVQYDNRLGGYTYENKLVDPQNVYFIDGKAGVFLVDEGKSIYTGAVYGAYNEILVTGKDSNGDYYSYWGAERTDPNETIGDKLTVGQYNDTISWLNNNIRDIHEDDIKQIQVEAAASSNGGTIGLQTNGEADSEGNPRGGASIPGTITIKNTENSGKLGNDVKIQFGSINEKGQDVDKFTVDAGSKVEGLKGTTTATAGDTLTGIKINGEEYQLGGGKTYSHGQGIAISDDNKISVDKGDGLEFTSSTDGEKLKVNANEDKGITVDGSGVAVNAGEGLAFETEGTDKGQLKVNVGDGLSIKDGQVINNLKVTADTNATKNNKNGGNWTVTDTEQENVVFKNTTLNKTDSGMVEGSEVQSEDKNITYGQNYKVVDTDGNIVNIEDVASANTLKNIDIKKIGDLQYNAGNETDNDETSIVQNDEDLTTAVGKLDNQVSANTSDIDVLETADKLNVKYDSDSKDKVTLGGLNSEGNRNISYTYNKENPQESGGVRLTNVAYATGNDGSEAVNVDYLNDNAAELISDHNNITVTEDTNGGADGGNWTIKDTSKPEGQQTFTNTTLDENASGKVANSEVQSEDKKTTYGQNYKVVDTDGNIVNIEDVASANTLKNIDIKKIGDLQYNAGNETDNDETSIVQNDEDLTTAVGKLDNQVSANTSDIDVLETADKLNVKYDSDSKDKVTLGGLNSEGNRNISYTYNKENPQESGGVRLTNVAYATGKDGSEAVNVDYLKDNAGELVAGNNNLKVSIDSDNDGNKDNWTITDTQQKGIVFKNTTLDVANSTSTPIGESGEKYGQNFTIYDTAGNAVKIKDIASAEVLKNVDTRLASTEGDVDIINGTLAGAVMYDKDENGYNKESVTLGGKVYDKDTKEGGTHLTNVAYATGKDGSEAVNVDYLKDNAGELVAGNNNLKVSIDSDNDGNKDNWTITDTQQKGIVFKNTTLDVANSTSTPIGESGEKYGQNFTIYDTAGNAVKIKDIASAEKLIEVDKTAQEAQTEAEKHSSVSVGDNLSVTESENTNGGIDYQVTLNPVVTLDGNESDNNKIILDGNNGTISVTNTVKKGQGQGPGRTTTNEFTFDNEGATFTNTIEKGYHDPITSTTNINGGTITTDTVKGLDNITWNKDIAKAVAENEDLQGIAATQGQLQTVDSKVNAGWIATDSQNHEVNITPDNNKLNFAGDENITVTAANNEIKTTLNDDIVLGDYLNGDDGVLIGGSSGTISATNSITVGEDQGLIIDGQKKEIQGLSNTTWNEKIANDAAVEGSTAASTAATQGQLQEVSKVANAGWTASDGTNSISVKPNETLNFVGDENLTVSADGTDKELKVSLNDDITLGDGENAIKIDGTNGTLNIGSTFAVAEDGTVLSDGDVIADADGEKYSLSEVGKYAVRYDKTNDGTSTITLVDGDDLSGTRIKNVADGVDPKDAVNVSQLEAVEATANAGWTASDGTNSISIKPNETLNFVGDENLTVSADGTDKKLKVSLNDNITLGNGQSAITLNGSPENSNDPALSVGTDKFVVDQDGSLSVSDKFNVDAETGNIYAANNSGSAIMMNDDSVALNAGGNGIAISDEGILLNTNGINEDIKLVTKGTSVSVDSNGTTFTNTNTNETTNINGGTINVGDKLMVEEDGSIYATNNNGSTVMINDDGIALNSEGNGVVVSDDGITLNANGSAVTVDRFNGTTFTNTNTGETTSINGGTITTDTVKGLSNTTWNDELATQVAKSEELQGTAATQGQLQQAVSAVATEAAKQHTTVSGDDNLTVKSSLNGNGGTNYQVTLNDDITLGNPKAGNTEGERSFTINTTDPEGYVPDSYKEENSSGAEFIKENGGFMLFATDTQGFGVFGVTAKGSAWAKDFKTYTTDIYGNNTQYSLNEIGDAVAQMSSYYNEENGKSYTVFSRYLNEAEKDNPFVTVDDNATRDIPLALRDDGAVLIGATIKGEDFTDNGIRINAETKTTYDKNGNEVTNNIATITGLENTEWKPPTPVATFAANDINTTSRAATEAQLNDLYNTVAAYDVNADGTVNYNHITLAGTPYNYGLSRSTDGTPTGGTSITNVAYASGNDGSEAVNVDYLKDAIKDATSDGGVIATTEKHLATNSGTNPDGSATYAPDASGNVSIAEVNGDGTATGNSVVISDVASKTELDSLKTNVGDLSYSKVQGDDVKDGDSVTTAIGKLDNKIENISGTATDAANNTVTGGTIKDDGTVSLTQKDGDTIDLGGKLTDSGVIQSGTEFDGETGTLTITSQDKYNKGTSSVTVSGIASKDDIGAVNDTIGVTSKEDLADAYKDADKDGNATTEYITDSETMVEADVALDHAIQDVAGTSYANDMVLSNRIDSVEKRLGNVEERIDKVGAMAAAIANLRTMGFDPEAPTEIAIGVGQYKSETGIAIGVFHYPNQDFMLSASLSSSGDELMGGIGATWKLGRKSVAERAKDEEARHLEQAEEMKKLAQQEKVKAQAQRHAKLLAERQQASQKNA